MIETKEQFGELRAEATQYAVHDKDARWLGAILTIEALREVARAGRNVVNEELHDWESEGYSSLYTLEEKLNALADWLTDG